MDGGAIAIAALVLGGLGLVFGGVLALESKAFNVPQDPLFGSVGGALLSGLFSVFLEYSTKYSLVYGSLASVMLVMVWMFVCGIIIISGAVLNHALNEASKQG